MAAMNKRISSITRMIETKENTRALREVDLAHNALTVLDINPFTITFGTDAPDAQGTGARIGDAISLRGMLIKAMFQNSFGRSKVYFRVMLIRCAKGDNPTRISLFKNSSNNKMLDQVDTDRYTVVAQKIFTISCTNPAASGVVLPGPLSSGVPNAGTPAGIGTKIVSMYLPGKKFGRGGYVQYENSSATQLKFYNYKICVLAYDWFQTAQDINNVGLVNEIYTKLYYKDA